MIVTVASDSPDAAFRTVRISAAGAAGLRLLALAMLILGTLFVAQAWQRGSRAAELERIVAEQAVELEASRARLDEMDAQTEELLAQLGAIGATVREVQEYAGLEPDLELLAPRLAAGLPQGGPRDGVEAPAGSQAGAEAGENELGTIVGAAREDLDALRGTVDEVRDTVALKIAEEEAKPRAWPVRGWVSSYFGMRRSPISGRMLMHKGMDIVAAYRTPIAAAGSGTVVKAGWSTEGYGYHVVIDHGFGYQTLYGHMSEVSVAAGDEVGVGDTVGLLGNTGYSTGAHLHFEVLRDGEAQDPEMFLPASAADAG